MIFLTRFFKPLLLYIPVIFLLAFPCVVQAHAKEDDSLFTKAEDLVNNGNYLDAVSIYREISISSDKPDTRARALLFIGSIYANDLDQLDAAITCYKDLIRSYPHSSSAPDALFCCGQIYYKNNKYSDAKKTFENYIRMYPKGIRLKSAMAWATDSEKKISDSPEKPAISKNLAPLSPYIRVLIVKNEKTIILTATSKISVKDAKSGSLLYTGQGPVNFTKSGKKIIINTRAVSSAGCSVTSENCCVSVNGCRYRGSMNIHNKPSGLIAVNHVDIESYLYGVIPKEMPCIWSPDALMAQAVASRTYALYIREKESQNGRDYDLESTTSSQVYGGIDAEKEQTRIAVDKTRGTVMTHMGKLIIAYFHSNSGGYTESAMNVWGVDIPYLESVEDSFSAMVPDSSWEYTVSYKDLFSLFKNIKPGLEQLTKIEPGPKTPSGRNETFTLVSNKKQVKISGNTFRLTLGPVKLKSTIFKIIPGQSGVTFKGIGFGHGVGMSQWGANRMGQSGYSYTDILKHYYKGVSICEVGYL